MYAVLTVKVFIIKNCPLLQVSTDSLQHFSAEGRGSHGGTPPSDCVRNKETKKSPHICSLPGVTVSRCFKNV